MQPDTVYTDFSKTFDKVNHNLLLLKLDKMDFSECLLKWIKTYLSGRTQKVELSNATSNPTKFRSTYISYGE